MITRSSPNSAQQSVEARWGLKWKLASVAHGDSYKGVHPDSRQSLVVWISRVPLNSGQQKAFRQHVARLCSEGTPSLVADGVDRSGIGYVALEVDSHMSLDSDRPGLERTRARFIECVAVIAALHDRGVSVGNISAGSFLLNHRQEVQFVGVLGGFEMGDMATLPPEVRACLPHGSYEGQLRDSRADVYALAVLGLKLFGAQFPPSGIKAEEVDLYLERLATGAPRWVLEVLRSIVRQPESSALRDAGDLLSLFADIERNSTSKKSESSRSYAPIEDRPQKPQESVQEIARRARLRGSQTSRSPLRRMVRSRFAQALVCCLLIGVALQASLIPIERFLGALRWFSRPNETGVPTQQQQQEAPSTGRGRGAQASLAELITRFQTEPGQVRHQQLWDVVSDSLQAKGYGSAAGLANGAVRSLGRTPQEVVTLADIMSPELSAQQRVEKLHAYDVVDPESASQVAAAFAADQRDAREVYRNFLVMSVSRSLPSPIVGQLSDRSTSAIIAASSLKGGLGGDRQAEIVRELSSADLWWLLELYAAKRSSQLVLLTDTALTRGICQGLRCSFLSLMRNSEVSPETPYEALISSARSGPESGDVERFAQWLAPQSEQALYLVPLTSSDHVVVKAALDGLQSKPQLDELVVGVMSVLRGSQQEVMYEYASLIGALGLRASISHEVLVAGLQMLRNEPLRTQIAQQIVQRGDSEVVKSLLSVQGAALHPNILLPLMEHKDPEVRLVALPLLKGLPLASSRATLERLYAKEEDPRVKEAYEREIFPR